MHFKNGRMAIVAFMSGLMLHVAASAQICTWDGGGDGSSWSDANNWSDNETPDTVDEKALIPNNGGSGYTVNVNSNVTCGALEIYERSTINIATSASATLTIDRGSGGAPSQNGRIIMRATSDTIHATINVGDADDDHQGILRLVNNDHSSPHQIGGEIILWETDSVLDIETDDTTFGPYGSYFGTVIGKETTALVEIDDGVELTNRIVFEGSMQLFAESGTAYFNNDRESSGTRSGVVWANASGSLWLGYNVIIDDDALSTDASKRPLWKASGAGTLEFDSQAWWLVGEFAINSCDATLAFMPITIHEGGAGEPFIQTAWLFTDGNGGAPYGYLHFRDGSEFCYDPTCQSTTGYIGDCP